MKENKIFFVDNDFTISADKFFILDFYEEEENYNQSLVIDIYNPDHAVHPDGHIGYWVYDFKDTNKFRGIIELIDEKIVPSMNDLTLVDSWINKNIIVCKNLVLIAVLRDKLTNKIISKSQIPIFKNTSDKSEYRHNDFDNVDFYIPNRVLDKNKKIIIISKNMHLRDAVGNLCINLYFLLKKQGLDVELFSNTYDLRMNHLISDYKKIRYKDTADTSLVYFYSIQDELLPVLLEKKFKNKILYFHKVTDPKVLQVFSTELAKTCEGYVTQINKFSEFDKIYSNSKFSVRSLIIDTRLNVHDKKAKKMLIDKFKNIELIPPFISTISEQNTFRNKDFSKELNFLFVGRIESSKRIEDILYLFEEILKLRPNSILTLVGSRNNISYSEYLSWLLFCKIKIPSSNLVWKSNLSEPEIHDEYLKSHIYLSMSADEGFGIPIYDAMRYGVLVFAFDIPAIREITKGVSLLFEKKDYINLSQRLMDYLSQPASIDDLLNNQYKIANQIFDSSKGSLFIDKIYNME